MILVVGATGMVGGEVCRLLMEKKLPFRAMVRSSSDPVKVDMIKSRGAELAVGDVREPKSLMAACRNVQTVICTISSMPFSYQPGVNDIQKVDLEGVKALIDTAKAAGVKQFIYTSFSMKDLDFPLCMAKRAVEDYLIKSGMDYTILRPGYFMEVWLSPAVGFDVAGRKAQIYGTGEQSISLISFKDVARFAVEALKNQYANNAILELGGPEAVSPYKVVEYFERKAGTAFTVTHATEAHLLEQYQGVDEPMQKSFLGLMICFAKGNPIDMKRTLQVFPLKLTSIEEFVEAG